MRRAVEVLTAALQQNSAATERAIALMRKQMGLPREQKEVGPFLGGNSVIVVSPLGEEFDLT